MLICVASKMTYLARSHLNWCRQGTGYAYDSSPASHEWERLQAFPNESPGSGWQKLWLWLELGIRSWQMGLTEAVYIVTILLPSQNTRQKLPEERRAVKW